MFKKILIANRGDKVRAADLAAKPHGVLRAAQARDLPAMEVAHV